MPRTCACVCVCVCVRERERDHLFSLLENLKQYFLVLDGLWPVELAWGFLGKQ
jgi:hypothetical protein